MSLDSCLAKPAFAHVKWFLQRNRQRNDVHTIYTDIAEAESEKRLGDECDVKDWLALKKYIEDYVSGGIANNE